MFDLTGKTILATGTSKGIGAEILKGLVAQGAHVVAHYGADQAGMAEALAGLPEDRVRALSADFRDDRAVDTLWERALGWRGGIDVLINNAAVMHWNGGIDEPDEVWDRVWHDTMQVNVYAPARLTRAALRHFRDRKGGIVVTVSSWAAQRGVTNPATAAYAASKAAIKAFTQTIARGYAKENILAYVIAPGVVRTRMSQDFAATQGGEDAVARTLAMGEMIPPGDVAAVAVFLASGASRHLTGATIDVNGASYVR
ncbi:MAG: SDR family NAD(P)-dependent oxidoreductase [Alphaproteobacteria bacterium]